jgi:hypothetical protein
MACNTRSWWCSPPPPVSLSAGVLKNTTFRKLDLFQSSCEGRETSSLLGPLERANLTTEPGLALSNVTNRMSPTLSHEDENRYSFRTPDDGQSPKTS